MRRARPLIPASILAAAALVLLAAGCAGGGSPATAATTTQSGTLAYARCMRAHAVPNFPDPTSSGEIPKDKIVLLAGSPQFQAAASACADVMPAGGLGPDRAAVPTRIRLRYALAFARCVRSRGFPSFPDPTHDGQLTPEMVTRAGVDLRQPALLRAGLSCAPVTHGLISRAAVERAVNGG
jgi:hypothetical protein